MLRDGAPVRIGGRALDILTMLVGRSGEIVGKKELIDYCWPDTFVHEDNLKVNIASLRRTLASDSGETYIATVAGRGYRFVAPVEVDDDQTLAVQQADTKSRTLPSRSLTLGRDQEISRIASMLAEARCVSIIGPGGVGKTTVAIAVAHQELPKHADGVYFIDLTCVGDPQYAIAAIAASVSARQRSEDLLSDIIEALHGKSVLLVIDNCEHLLSTIAAIADRLLNKVPTIRILATSREPFRIGSERIYRLPTLDVPATGIVKTAKQALTFASVQLFVARAQERGTYVLSDGDAPLVSAICQRLDGIALAIELAASKTATFGVPTLLTMIEQRFLLLSNDVRAAPLRQQTLLATLDWSYRLLSEDEASLLRFLSVFAGAFRIHDVVAMSKAAGLDTSRTVDALERLTQKSMLSAEYQDGTFSYRLLESTRAYALERQMDAGERHRALLHHARHILDLYERAAEERALRAKSDWMAEYASRIDDLRNALAWAFGPADDRVLGIRLTVAAIPLWMEMSSVSEMLSRIERALSVVHDLTDCPADLVMKLVAARASGMSFAQHLAPAIEGVWEECYLLGVKTKNAEYQLHGLWGLAAYLIYVGRPLEAVDKLCQFMAIAEAESDWPALAEGNRMMGMAEIYIGKISSARQRLEKLAATQHRSREPVRLTRFQAERDAHVKCSLAIAFWISGEPDRAMHVAQAAVERAEATGHVVSQSNVLAVCAIPISLWTDDLESAAKFLAMLEENGRHQDIGIWREVCRFFRSALRAKRREAGAATEMKARLEDLIAARNLLRAPMHYSMVAEALLGAGAIDEAKEAIEEAGRLAQAQTANWCVPEILRISGLIAFATGGPDEAERLLRLAIDKALEIGALTLELRAAAILSEFLEDDHRCTEAADLLAASCAKFSETTDYAQLATARARLQHLLHSERVACI
ncbi:Predicted ATPase [Bosea lupini]|uniref:Predicted ATPase n=1 Tax=Bosea lupini TaxID=1036779 RepID=A0A1H7WBE9_9HYPH|nr:winged helix-turn-helix domain-containing protein [Bosea lupini]SEM18267.1 Predicted ATPase [Bosea lupini]